jgi:ATP adenylyltransferase
MRQLYAPWRLEYIESGAEPRGCIFCDFPAQTADAKNLIVARGEHAFHILNRFPYSAGHVMVVPYAHITDLATLPDAAFTGLHRELLRAQNAVRAVYKPHGLNVGMNLGRAGGAGIADHLHYHVVPRWLGDVNFMPVLADTKVISSHLEDSFARLSAAYA